MSCIDRFGERMNELMNRYRAVLESVNELAVQTRLVLEEDVYFAGLLHTNCEKYRYGENSGFIGICGDRLFEVINISYGEEWTNYPLHNILASDYYRKLPIMPYIKANLLRRDKAKITIRTIYGGMGSGIVDVAVPRESLDDKARRFHIPLPGLAIDLEIGYIAIELSINGYRFAIKYKEDKPYLEGGYPQGFENSPTACAITDAVVEIITDAINLYEDITNKGIKFVSIYLLY